MGETLRRCSITSASACATSAAPGLHHVAFPASERAVVEEAHAIAVAAGAEILEAPREFDYEPGCYATFFRDPDGFKLEVVCRR
jgi:catechol 2,3-dioxygenase-like lactoylglutathione lyase family enzyme